MKSVVYTRNGDSSVMELVDRAVPEPGFGEVRVKVLVSGVNPTDWKSRVQKSPLEFAEITPNQDGAGVIDALGEGVEEFHIGDRVWLNLTQHERPGGTAQEYTVVPIARVAALPDDVGFDVGASLGVPAVTAHRALTVHEFGPTRLGPQSLAGRTVLVQGGAGAVGNAAIQLAAWSNATVIATVSSDEKAELARAAGAHHVLRYPNDNLADEILALAPNGVDHIVEVSPAANASVDMKVIANQGCIAFYANNNGNTFTLPVGINLFKNIRWQALILYTLGEDQIQAAVADIGHALVDGAFGVGEASGLPLTWFSLEDTAAAHDAVENGAVGKVLIRM